MWAAALVGARQRSCVARRRGGLLGLRRSGVRGGVVVVDGDGETSQTRGGESVGEMALPRRQSWPTRAFRLRRPPQAEPNGMGFA